MEATDGASKLQLIEQSQLSKTDLLDFLKNIYLARKLDDAEIAMRKQNTAYFQISGAGHEGVQVAAGKLLRPGYDYFLPYYRDRAFCLALGVTPYQMLCQANGNTGDISSGGRQMPSHWGHAGLNIISKSSCTGTQFLQAVGLAEAGNYYQSLVASGEQVSASFHHDEIIYTSCGDGTVAQGEFWEALTTATVRRLRILFLVEDNGLAISVPRHVQIPGGSISAVLAHFPQLQVYAVDGNCPIASFAVLQQAIGSLRAGHGPVLVHASVVRPYSHSLSDDQFMYRTAADLAQEHELDVFYSYPRLLLGLGLITEQERAEVETAAYLEVKAAMKAALATAAPLPASCRDHLFAAHVLPPSAPPRDISSGDLPMAMAINQVLKHVVATNPLVVVFGEDVADFSDPALLENDALKGKGGVFKVTSNVQRGGRPGQVFNSPLAEANIIGRAIGMALRGLKPVVEIQFFDYIWTAFMQLKNEMATMRYRSNGAFCCPLVVRVPIGGYLRGGAIYHSQCGESFFTHIPGIYVVYPSNAQDAAGLLNTAISGADPVLFLEHKHLYYQGYNRTGALPADFMIPFGQARVVQKGEQVTVVAWGALVQKTVEAANILRPEGVGVEIVDPRTLVPFDLATVRQSLSKTHRLLICHEETQTSGFAGEICALINEHCFELLDAPIFRVTALDSHIPYRPELEEAVLPSVEKIVGKIRQLLKY